MRIISWNVNGIRAAVKKGLLDWMSAEQPDILCLQEVKALPEQLDESVLKVEGYQMALYPAKRKGYSGVATYSRPAPDSVVMGTGNPRFDEEGRTLITQYGGLLLYNVYFPNGNASGERLAYKMDFYDDLLAHAAAQVEEGRSVLICGDYNTAHKEIDLARPKENSNVSGFLPIERAWMDKLCASGFVDTFRMFHGEGGRYSWWDMKTRARERNVGWRLDYFFADRRTAARVKDAFIMEDVMGSDHCPVGIEIE